MDDDDAHIVVDLKDGARFQAHSRMNERTASDDIEESGKRYRARCRVDELPVWLGELKNLTDVICRDRRGHASRSV